MSESAWLRGGALNGAKSHSSAALGRACKAAGLGKPHLFVIKAFAD